MKALHLALVALLFLSALGAGVPSGGDAVAARGPGPGASAPASTAADGPERATEGPVREVEDPATAPVTRRLEAPSATPVSPQTAPPGAPGGTVNVLGIEPATENRSGFHETYVDLGPVLGFESGSASGHLETLRAVERVESAESAAERAERLRTEIGRIEARTDALGAEQRGVLGAYARNESTAEELLVELARIDREARALDERRRRLWAVANGTDVDLDEARLESLGRELDLYTGAVRERMAASLAGDAPTRRFYVAATPRSVVLATLTGDAYLRESYRGDLRSVGGGELDATEAAGVVERGYPEIWESRESVSAEGGAIAGVDVAYPGGNLSVSMGSGNSRAFADEHSRSLDAVASNVTATNTRDGLRLTVERTYAGGPLRLQLENLEGDRVDAEVTLGPAGGRSVSVGHTGGDGVLWTLSPDERFTVVAIRDQNVVFLTMDPLATREPGGEG